MSVEGRCQYYSVPQLKRPTVMTATLVFRIWMTYLAQQGPLDSRLPRPCHTPPQSPPIRKHTKAPTQRTHTSVPRTRQSAVCPPLQGPQGTPRPQDNQGPGVSGNVHTVQGKEAQANSDTGRTAVHQWEDRPRPPTLQEALSEILEAYQHSQDTMSQILDNVQENATLQEGQYQGIREDLQAINNTLISIAGVLADMPNIMRETVLHQRAPATSQTSELPSTSAAASGQEAPPQDQQATSTPPPAEGEHPANVPCNPDRSQRHLPRPPPGN
ncbi:hypothetical protein NDU88_004679 [Pleurodeles waltl]|uniref:Uncharacterized protein n=1 Tax=Pleurodeles waltl TaxID=8319 RepID=A0AAV7NK54_PLEWA|nr:hypothetical protein NDU88_004679 [Pleurodeles waltl]